MKMLRKNRTSGFSLVELMVVIAIIAILVALLVPGVNMVIRRAKNAKTKLEIANLANALEAFKLEYGDYPPDFTTNNPAAEIDLFLARKFRYRVKSTDSNSLPDVVPPPVQIPETAIIEPVVASLDPTEALYFWLRGFSAAARYPISGDLNNDVQMRLNEDRKPLFEFDRTRITDQDLDGNPEYLPETSEAEKVPYIYYHNRTYINGSQWVRFKSNVMSVPWVQQQTVGIPLPYRSKTADPIMLGDGTTQPGFAENQKFQIIAAGMDGIFGAQGGIYPDGVLYTDYDRDNATSFIQGATLKDDIP